MEVVRAAQGVVGFSSWRHSNPSWICSCVRAPGDPAWAGGLIWMISSGPSQPQPFHDPVTLGALTAQP